MRKDKPSQQIRHDPLILWRKCRHQGALDVRLRYHGLFAEIKTGRRKFDDHSSSVDRIVQATNEALLLDSLEKI